MPIVSPLHPPSQLDWETPKRKKKKNTSNIVRIDSWNLVSGRQTATTYVTYDVNLGRFKVVNK
jgi:hypothetical protein